jgi:hypothetical protein
MYKNPHLPKSLIIHGVFCFAHSQLLMTIGMIVLLWIIGLILLPADASGQAPPDATRSSFPPGVGINVKVAPEIATVGDPVRIDMDITMPAGYRVDIPKPELQIGDLTILDFSPGPIIPDGGKSPKPTPAPQTQAGASQHHQAQIVASVYKTGKFTFPSIRMNLYASDGRAFEISSPPVNFEIRSILSDKNQNLKDLKKQADIPDRWRWILWCIIAAAIIILGAGLWIVLKRRRRRPIPLSPAQVQNLMDLAEVDLRSLLARGFPDSGNEKQFYILLSEIIKRILETGYEIHTTEQTTSEIMSSLYKKTKLESGKPEMIEDFLIRCDVVKFAKYIPSRIDHETASKDALQILVDARKAVSSRQSEMGSKGEEQP